MTGPTYSEILQRNRELGATVTGEPLRVAVLSNVVVAQIKEILEFALRSRGLNASVEIGDYDNVVQDAERYAGVQAVVIFWEACNLIPGAHWRVPLMSDDEAATLAARVSGEIDLVLSKLSGTRLVLFNRFSSLAFNLHELRENAFDRLCLQLNRKVDDAVDGHLLSVDIDRVIAQVGVNRSVDWRNFYSSRAPYTVELLRAYTEQVVPAFMASTGRSRKAMIFDCDNTLWDGVLGEDGEDGIAMSEDARKGRPFAEVQGLARILAREGVIVGLCSKNNPEDVSHVLDSHPDMILKEADIAVRRVNWSDKATNLRDIAASLNIGLDSLVFVDDSDFEIGLVREQLPEIATVTVPQGRHEYPALLRLARGMFFTLSRSAEDAVKARMYREASQREAAAKSFASIEDYLRSLGLRLTLHVNDASLLPRMAQLTQKTNQFNVTTRRYSEADLRAMLEGGAHRLLAFRVADNFGDYGITGLAIVARDPGDAVAVLDTYLMSCRVLGRNLERAFFDHLIRLLEIERVSILRAEYIRTTKNDQVKDLFERLGMRVVRHRDSVTEYELQLAQHVPADIDYIEIESAAWNSE